MKCGFLDRPLLCACVWSSVFTYWLYWSDIRGLQDRTPSNGLGIRYVATAFWCIWHARTSAVYRSGDVVSWNSHRPSYGRCRQRPWTGVWCQRRSAESAIAESPLWSWSEDLEIRIAIELNIYSFFAWISVFRRTSSGSVVQFWYHSAARIGDRRAVWTCIFLIFWYVNYLRRWSRFFNAFRLCVCLSVCLSVGIYAYMSICMYVCEQDS